VAAGEVSRLQRSWADSVSRLRTLRRGIVLGPDPHDHDHLLGVALPPREDLRWVPGRGWLVDGRPVDVVQLARPAP